MLFPAHYTEVVIFSHTPDEAKAKGNNICLNHSNLYGYTICHGNNISQQ